MDSLSEEREQKITVDSSHIDFSYQGHEFSIIDAPGHKQFIKNMITGASQANAAVLLVDAREGIQEQTYRHLYLLNILGIDRIIAAVNKMDQVNYDSAVYDRIKHQLLEIAKKLDFEFVAIIPISALKGDLLVNPSPKMPWYRGTPLIDQLVAIDIQTRPLGEFRLPVQGLFKLDDTEYILGTVASGEIAPDTSVAIYPGKQSARIKSIQQWHRQLSQATPGMAVALNIELADPDASLPQRGNIIGPIDNSLLLTNVFDATLFIMDNTFINVDEPLELCCSTQKVNCRIVRITRKQNAANLEIIENPGTQLADADIAGVEIATDQNICIEDFQDIPTMGRFTLLKSDHTIAGGVINKTSGL